MVIIDHSGSEWLKYCIPRECNSFIVKIHNVLPLVKSFSFLYNILRSVVKTGFTGTSLLSAIILELKPRVVITHCDDNKFMGALQTIFPDVLIISVQNGTRSVSDLSFELRQDYLEQVFFPKKIVTIDEFPRSPSGKIDRKTLSLKAQSL